MPGYIGSSAQAKSVHSVAASTAQNSARKTGEIISGRRQGLPTAAKRAAELADMVRQRRAEMLQGRRGRLPTTQQTSAEAQRAALERRNAAMQKTNNARFGQG
jgi:hypothetical protein